MNVPIDDGMPLGICDSCGKDVPLDELASVTVQGCEGDFCATCRGVPCEQDEADHYLEQRKELALERERGGES